MHPYLRYATDHLEAILGDITELVAIESPTGYAEGIERVCATLAAHPATANAMVQTENAHLRIDFQVAGAKHSTARILGLGHSDTVWPVSTLQSMPIHRDGGRLHGPGVLDMKAGLVFFLWAVRLLRELQVPVRRPVSLLVVADEETGSKTSRALTETEGKNSGVVLVLEPGAGLVGKLKTARKGVGRYCLKVNGIAAHAGVDFANGASAIVELAGQIERIAKLTGTGQGITVNPGVISGGTASNVVAAEAEVAIDVRAWSVDDAEAVDKELRSLTRIDPRCKLTVSGGLNRPPMERTPAIADLYKQAHAIASELGLPIEESSTGGGSDGNFTAALGIPTLDGLGAVGEGAHAAHENIVIEAIPGRVALLAGLLSRL